MNADCSMLILGLGPFALAAARAALLSGAAVAVHVESFSAPLDKLSVGGVEFRLARDKNTFLAGLRQRAFIPVLVSHLARNVEQWPWDVLIDARVEEGARRKPQDFAASLRVALGAGPVAGRDCDIVVAVDGPDPGALIHEGAAPARAESGVDLRALFGLAPEPTRIGALEKTVARATIFAIEAERGGWSCPPWPSASDENM